MRELRLQGVATCLNYSSADVDKERELEAPPGFQPQPLEGTEGQAAEATLHGGGNADGRRAEPLSSQPHVSLGGEIPRRAILWAKLTMVRPLEGGYENDAGSLLPLTKWIEEFQFLDGLKVLPHVGYYDGKGDPDNFIHIFKGAMRMEKWAMSVTCHMFVYILKDVARVWWNNFPKGIVVNYEDLKKRFRTHFKQQKK
ncbi:hypothetical protein Tco_1391216 [Tanacetum coccineum]